MASFVPSQFDGAEMLFVETYPVFLWTPGAGLPAGAWTQKTGCPVRGLPGLLWFQPAFTLFRSNYLCQL